MNLSRANPHASAVAATSASLLARWIAPDRAFAVIALVFGNALVLIIPPFQVADDSFHFLRAYQITDGVLVPRQPDARGVAMGEFPVSLYQVWLPFSHMGFNPSTKASLQDIRDALRIPLNPSRRMQIALPSTAYYSPACYLPQCLGIIVGRALGMGPLAMMYLGREANLLAWTLLGYLSLRSAPGIARPLFLLLLMPMSMYLAATVSADVSTNAFAVLFTATVLKYSVLPEPDSIGPGRFLTLLILSAGAAAADPGAQLRPAGSVRRPDVHPRRRQRFGLASVDFPRPWPGCQDPTDRRGLRPSAVPMACASSFSLRPGVAGNVSLEKLGLS